jgi:toxin ParE1/3/4
VKLGFAPAAIDDVRQAFDFYESQRAGLGAEFAIELARAIRRAIESPEAWPSLTARLRRCPTKRFPYGVLYSAAGGELTVVAVMHLHRDPAEWKSRRA